VRIVGREQQPIVESGVADALANSSGSSGSSIGWVVNQTCSRTISDGRRSIGGVSSRSSSQALSSDQMSGADHATPASVITRRRSGNAANAPSQMKFVSWDCMRIELATCSSR